MSCITRKLGMSPCFHAFDEYSETEAYAIHEMVEAVRSKRLTRKEKKQKVVLSFWGFGCKERCTALVESLCRAFRIRTIFCSDVAVERFEGVLCLYRGHVECMEQIAAIMKMSMGLLEVGAITDGTCLRCNPECMHLGFAACLLRIEKGQNKRGEHPTEWGCAFRDFIVNAKMQENVLKITGLSFDANNMIMLFFSHSAAEQHARHSRERLQELRRENGLILHARQHALMLERENSRMLFAVQCAYRRGAITAEALHSIICGDV